MNTDTQAIVDKIIEDLREEDVEEGKVARENKDTLVGTSMHSLVRAFWCYANDVTPASPCQTGDLCRHSLNGGAGCGYVIGYSIYKWLLYTLEPDRLAYDKSLGCGYRHDRDITNAFMTNIISYLTRTIPNPRQDKCFNGVVRIRNYIAGILSHYAKIDTDQTYQLPIFKNIMVFHIGKSKSNEMVNMIVTNNKDIFSQGSNNQVVAKQSDGQDDDAY